MGFRDLWPKMEVWGGGQNRGRGNAILTPNELVLWVLTFVPILVKIDQEMRPRECSQTERHTDTQCTHRRKPIV